MHITRCICPLTQRVRSREVLRKFSASARLYEASSTTTQPQVTQEKFDFEDLKISERAERRKPQIPPFMKDVFMSIYNRDLLEYPEILIKDESDALDSRVKLLEDILDHPDMSDKDKESSIRRTGIFGAPINLTQGGLALIATERLRYLEALSANVKLASSISDHWVGIGALKVGLADEEFNKLVPDLIDGEKLISICTNERISTRVAQEDFRASAHQDVNGVWHVRGEKLCANPDGYKLALCRVDDPRIKALLVHPGAPGVSYNEPYVTFDDAPASLLDRADEATLSSAMALARLDTCALSYNALRRLTLETERYVRGKFVSAHPLGDLPLIRTKVSEAMVAIYTAESMAYFTAGLLDGYESPDADIEVAMCRAYITERSVSCAQRLLSIVGLEGMREEWTGSLNDLRALQMKDEQMDTLHIYIALAGMQHAGKQLATEVKQMRNPLFHPSFIFKKVFEDRHQAADNPTLTLYLEEKLHPSLKPPAQKLEYCALRLRYASEQLLARYGADLYIQHSDLERIAKAATEVLAMTAVLARASRSYCIGLRNAEIEMRLAATVAEIGRKRVQELILDLDNGEYLNLDTVRNELGRKILDTGSMLVERPTARVWW